MSTGSRKRVPPCTTRWTAASNEVSGRSSSAFLRAADLSGARVASEPQSACALATGSRVPTTIALTLSELEPALMTRTRVIAVPKRRSVRPGPARDLRGILTGRPSVGGGGQSGVDHLLPQRRRPLPEARYAVDNVDDQVEAVDVVAHGHVERRRDRALFLVAPDVQVGVVGA